MNNAIVFLVIIALIGLTCVLVGMEQGRRP